MVDVLSTRITLKKLEGREELVSDFQFSTETNATLQDLFAYARTEWKQKNLALATPEKFLFDVEPVDWKYI
jgi:hypothetical protein